MNFTLAAQGYLSGGLPEPFAKQPLYRTIFQEKHQKYRPMVDPCTLKAFLATYQVQYVVLTARAIDYETYWVRNIGASGWAEPNKERTKIKHS